MFTKRFLLALIACTLMLPLSGCGCRRHSCCGGTRTNAPPAGCCDKGGLPPGYIPAPGPQP